MDSTTISMLGGIALTGVITYAVTRFSKAFDARSQAEAALIGIGPQIIKEQNERIDRQNARIDELSTTCETLWDRERECRVELAAARVEIEALDRRYRHFVAALLQNVVILRRMLRQGGAELPPMISLEQFEEEGGRPREEWIRVIQAEESC